MNVPICTDMEAVSGQGRTGSCSPTHLFGFYSLGDGLQGMIHTTGKFSESVYYIEIVMKNEWRAFGGQNCEVLTHTHTRITERCPKPPPN